jgi:pSer/pThr/pTyr-binding forkhead associated (FHA) protein
MSAAITYVDIEVMREGQRLATGRYKVPLTFGRAESATIQLGIDPPDAYISRIHARVEIVGRRLVVLDLSKNGTVHDGRTMHNREIVALKPNDCFRIRDYLIRISGG